MKAIPLPPTPGNQSRRTSIGDMDDLRPSSDSSEGEGGGKKYGQIPGRIAVRDVLHRLDNPRNPGKNM